jgi:hypothetical protein
MKPQGKPTRNRNHRKYKHHEVAGKVPTGYDLAMKPMATLSLTLALISGCVLGPSKTERFDAIMKSWLGSQSSDLVAKWGPPQNVMRDKDGEIWTYYESRQWTTPGRSFTTSTANAQTYGSFRSGSIFSPPGYSGNTAIEGQSVTTYRPPETQSYTCRRTFFVNKDGVIYRYGWQGL